MNIAIIGGGAAGCFAAINIKRRLPEARVTVYEGGRKPLAKVAITGGGRCNLTNSFRGVKSVDAVYPRGARLMKRLLREFSHEDAYRWFEKEGIRLTTQADECVFPVSQDALEIVNMLLRRMSQTGVDVRTSHRVSRIERCNDTSGKGADGISAHNVKDTFIIHFADSTLAAVHCDAVVVTTGGSPKPSGLSMLDGLGLEMADPVPSLFSFCLPKSGITALTGTVVEDISVGITGTKLRSSGPLLITHWGMSGPAILKLSAHGARLLHDSGYKAQISVNWFGEKNEQQVAERLYELAVRNPQKQLSSVYPDIFNSRLWVHLLVQSGLRPEQRWAELGKKSYNKLAATLTNDIYNVDGKNRFKEEFVTCGGVALGNVDSKTLECKTVPNLYFAGEVLDVDAVTGGFNLQAAWTMAHVVAKAIGEIRN